MSGWNAMPSRARRRCSGWCARRRSSSSRWSTRRRLGGADRGRALAGAGLVAHIADTTEAYFVAFDAARPNTRCRRRTGCRDGARVTNRRWRCGRTPGRAGRTGCVRTRQDDGIFDALVQEDGRVHRPALLHGSAAVVLLPGVPVDGLRRPLLGHPAGHRPRAWAVGEAADLLVPFMFVCGSTRRGEASQCELGIRITADRTRATPGSPSARTGWTTSRRT